MQKMTQAVGLLLDYMNANHDCFTDSKELFQTFVKRLYTGTIGENGTDPSCLYWLPKSNANVRQLTYLLSGFSDWMAEKLNTKPLNSWRAASAYEEMLNWAAWHQKHHRTFLAHTWNRGKVSEAAKLAKNSLLKRNPKIDHDGVKFFPDDHIYELLFNGFIVPSKKKSRRIEERLNLRDILITILMHFGGVRVSEPFHLFVHDVCPDPYNSKQAMVRIYHPNEGMAPKDWFDSKGKDINCNREAYLLGKYGMHPRNMYFSTDQLHSGWKGNCLDSKNKFMNIHWFPSWGGELFLMFWNIFIIQRALKDCDHPYAFVTEEGKPYSVNSFICAHNRAVERIGLLPTKNMGTTPHGHRHAFGQRMADAEIDPIIIMKAMHHNSLESQLVYTKPKVSKVTKIFNDATESLNEGRSLTLPDFLMYGFEDVDPLGLLSGPNPKLRRF
jgi:integrase